MKALDATKPSVQAANAERRPADAPATPIAYLPRTARQLLMPYHDIRAQSSDRTLRKSLRQIAIIEAAAP